MATNNWQLDTPVDAVIFDCDGTLSTIEGIDELAHRNGVYEEVKKLTAEAMGKTGMNPVLYRKRLDLVKPTLNEVLALGQTYLEHQVADIVSVIRILKKLNKKVYIISAGLLPAVKIFGEILGVAEKNIFAVDIKFDSEGNYSNFDETSPLAYRDGKHDIVSELKKQHPRIVLIGDGLNDYAAYDVVTRFIGYGGAYYRQNIADLCQFYITTLSMAPVIPLAITQNEVSKLSSDAKSLYQQGLQAIEGKKVLVPS